MTDEAERRAGATADEVVETGGPAATDGDTDTDSDTDGDTDTDDATDTAVDASDAIGDADQPIDFSELSLPQRVFVAAVQNPTRGVVLVGLLAFAFSFYIALWLVFARAAAFLSAVGLVLVGIVVAVYVLSNRLS
ncbi:hypothetical protein C461_15035 [Halorubrum aidingense JCM 13560]|uniref:Uncharacterized protein n=1 Tax=Halorubrum aidingense JCM 13560 TaxID=1230454 RepID=M0P4U6_9EURY|nr:hypothetical protein [Halorubrum aidingense]EMA65167.1 hypothetical protein C461_15035 [Halorubrum aidingense JCM 13560]